MKKLYASILFSLLAATIPAQQASAGNPQVKNEVVTQDKKQLALKILGGFVLAAGVVYGGYKGYKYYKNQPEQPEGLGQPDAIPLVDTLPEDEGGNNSD